MSKIRDAWERRRQRKRLDESAPRPLPKTLVPQPPARPAQFTVPDRGYPAFSKARRARNKTKNLAKFHGNARTRLPHGRQVKSGNQVRQTGRTSNGPSHRV